MREISLLGTEAYGMRVVWAQWFRLAVHLLTTSSLAGSQGCAIMQMCTGTVEWPSCRSAGLELVSSKRRFIVHAIESGVMFVDHATKVS